MGIHNQGFQHSRSRLFVVLSQVVVILVALTKYQLNSFDEKILYIFYIATNTDLLFWLQIIYNWMANQKSAAFHKKSTCFPRSYHGLSFYGALSIHLALWSYNYA
jgi:hypothetical protein